MVKVFLMADSKKSKSTSNHHQKEKHGGKQNTPSTKELLFLTAQTSKMTAINSAIALLDSIVSPTVSGFTLLTNKVVLTENNPWIIVPSVKVFSRYLNTTVTPATPASFIEGSWYQFVDPYTLRNFFIYNHQGQSIFFLGGCEVPPSAKSMLTGVITSASPLSHEAALQFISSATSCQVTTRDAIVIEVGRVYLAI